MKLWGKRAIKLGTQKCAAHAVEAVGAVALHKKYEIGFFSVRPLRPLCLSGEETRRKHNLRVTKNTEVPREDI